MNGFNPRWIVGKTIASVDNRVFTAPGDPVGHDPLITFTDGSTIRFVTEETEGGEYGTSIIYAKAAA